MKEKEGLNKQGSKARRGRGMQKEKKLMKSDRHIRDTPVKKLQKFPNSCFCDYAVGGRGPIGYRG
jgi:hypothetical protein